MLLPGSRLNGGNNLPCNTQLSKGSERGELITTEISNRFVESNHTLLDNIFTICSDQEV